MTTTPRRHESLWSRFRIPIILGVVVVAIALIALVHFRYGRRPVSGKGSSELLQIGALPVT